MKIKEKMLMGYNELLENGPINIVILGDSVSHGAFNDYMDYENVYWNVLKKRLYKLHDYVPINMINSSIGGTLARDAVRRLDTQVLNHAPDLVIVCFGLNDINGTLDEYLSSLEEIFKRCTDEGVEVIFMTPNMLNTSIVGDTPKKYYEYALKMAEIQNNGTMDKFIYKAKELASSMSIPVCDVYSKWKKLSLTEDVTMLLSNRINHPTEEMHKLFADSLYEMIVDGMDGKECADSTMYKD